VRAKVRAAQQLARARLFLVSRERDEVCEANIIIASAAAIEKPTSAGKRSKSAATSACRSESAEGPA
jgi:hypothetical protein